MNNLNVSSDLNGKIGIITDWIERNRKNNNIVPADTPPPSLSGEAYGDDFITLIQLTRTTNGNGPWLDLDPDHNPNANDIVNGVINEINKLDNRSQASI